MTTKTEVLQAIRDKCIECCCGQLAEVRDCQLVKCALHSFRMGKDPAPARKLPSHLTVQP